ncbi:MAG: helix-turn-helix domain-containing protein [Dethiobacteria bacterium]|jgi:transcriptional regulator with XRE-family HTH domain
MTINARIKKIRLDIGLTQVEFTKKLGITQPSLSDIEKGKTVNIDERTIKLICQEFNVYEEWLRTGEGEMFRTESDLLELLGAQLDNLDELDKRLIIEYVKLEPKHKKIFKDFIKKMTT